MDTTRVALEQSAAPENTSVAGAVSAIVPDWSREELTGRWDPGRQLLGAIRRYQRRSKRNGPVAFLMRKRDVLMHRFWSAVTGADVPLNASIGGGLLIPHPNGIVIHPDAIIGPNCIIFQQVTLGTGGRKPGAPRVGGHVLIGAGSKIIGGAPARVILSEEDY
jgi:serine O-acetyltransferase